MSTNPALPSSKWTAREAEILAITLRLLDEHGYDRFAVETVATEAKASKATVYRRWPTKADLVVAAFIEGACAPAIAPRTGSLRSDLLQIGAQVFEHAERNAGMMRGVLAELSRNPALSAAFQEEFIHQRRLLMVEVLTAAVERGEIDAAVISDEIWDVLPGYLVFRILIPGRTPTVDTVQKLVDEVLLPSLTRTRK